MAISKKTTHKITYSRAVISMGTSQIEAIMGGLQERYGARMSPERIREVRQTIHFHCKLLDETAQDYETAENTLSRELGEDIMARDQQSQAADELTRFLAGCRQRVRENLGESALRMYRLHESTPGGREALRRYGAEVRELLQKNPRSGDDMFGGEFSTASLAARLGPAVAAMQTSLDEVFREERETQAARAQRNQMEAHFRVTLINVASIIEAHLRMAGLNEQADRIRPTLARASGEVDTGDAPDAPDSGAAG